MNTVDEQAAMIWLRSSRAGLLQMHPHDRCFGVLRTRSSLKTRSFTVLSVLIKKYTISQVLNFFSPCSALLPLMLIAVFGHILYL